MPPVKAVLAYETPIAPFADPNVRRVIVPNLPGWQPLGQLRVAIPINACVIFACLILLAFVRKADLVCLALLAVSTYSAVPLFVMLAVAIHRRFSQTAIEVTPLVLRLIVTDAIGTRRTEWPRSSVKDIFVSPVTLKLRIRITGKDTRSVYLGPNRAMNELILHELIAAQAAIPPTLVDIERPASDDVGLQLTLSRLLEPQKKEFWT